MHGWLHALNNSKVSKKKLQEIEPSNANDQVHLVGIHSTISTGVYDLNEMLRDASWDASFGHALSRWSCDVDVLHSFRAREDKQDIELFLISQDTEIWLFFFID